MIKRAFTEHPASVGETYFEHMGCAFGFSMKMIGAGFACLLHAIFPFLFVRTGRDCIEDLHHRMVTHRDKRRIDETSKLPAMNAGAADVKAAE